MALGFRVGAFRQARRRAGARAALGVAGWAAATALLPTDGAAQPAALASLTCTASDVLNVAVTKGDRQLTVTWDAVEDASRYDVTWSPASGDGSTTARVEGTTHTITGLSNIVEYTVGVQADTTLACSATVPTSFPQCPTSSLAPSVTPEDEQLTVLWDPVSGVTEYEIGWNPPSTDGGRVAEVQNPVYVIASLQNDVGYTITVSAGPDNACSLDGTPVGREAMPDPDDSDADDADPDDADPDDADPDDADDTGGEDGPGEDGPEPVPAIPFGGLAGLALALMGAAYRGQRSASPPSDGPRSPA